MNKRLRAQLAHIAEQRAPKPKVSLEKADALMAGAFRIKSQRHDVLITEESSTFWPEDMGTAYANLTPPQREFLSRKADALFWTHKRFQELMTHVDSQVYKPLEGAQAAFINAAMPLDKP
jgi:hypothetical protein